MTQPYDRQRVPQADVLERQKSRLSDIWRRWFDNVVGLLHTKVGLPWKVDETTGDLYPDDNSGAGVGTLDNPVSHVAVGTQTALGIEGIVLDRPDANGGGLAVVGFRNEDPTADPTPNAPVELVGTVMLITGGQLWLETPDPTAQDEDRYLIAAPSVTDSRGRHYVPVQLGPKVIYAQEDSATDTRDLALSPTPINIVTLTLTNAYNAGDFIFRYGVQLSELGGRTADFTIELRLNGGLMDSILMSLSGGTFYKTETIPTVGTALAINDVITMDVSAVGTHVNSDPWVEGSVRASLLEVRQGATMAAIAGGGGGHGPNMMA